MSAVVKAGHKNTEHVGSPTLHATIFLTIGVFIAALIMSLIFEVEVVARGEGRVVPIRRVQIIQPEFSGRVTAIHVWNGRTVAKGDLLIELDSTEANVEFGKVSAEQDLLAIEAARLDAMIAALRHYPARSDFVAVGKSMFVVPETLLDHPSAIELRLLLVAELEAFQASLDQIDAREEVSRKSEGISSANIDQATAAMEIQGERLRAAERLLQNGTASRSAFLDVQQAFTDLERQRDIYLAERAQKTAERAALESERRRIVADLRDSLHGRKAEIRARTATLTEEARKASRRVAATKLTAPTSGVVDGLAVYTIGGIAEAGAELLRVVPTKFAVEIEGAFSNHDIGFMAEGQQANIRVDAYPSERFGFLTGRVTYIAADSAEFAEKRWAYVVRVAPDQSLINAGTDKFPLRPGMTASIDVITDERRVIGYFFDPIVRTIQGAMGER